MPKTVLVCEDEDVIRDFVVINLKRAGYTVIQVSNGEDALASFEANRQSIDVALLDIMMPGIDGFAVCKKLREVSPTMGIIMLSAKTQEMDKVGSLMIGADDYVTKPFSPSELIARVDAIYRRVSMLTAPQQAPATLTSGPFVLSQTSRTLRREGRVIDLTQVEYQMMELFLSNKNVALERLKMLKSVWGEDYYGDVKIVDVNIRRLRMKIEKEPSNPQYIQTIWGFGYKWSEESEAQ